MKIAEIITEDSFDNDLTYEQVKAMIQKSCGPYLKKIGGFENAVFKKPLFRGVNFFMHDPVKFVNVDQNRKPVDMPEPIHNLINDWFVKRTGIPFRSASVFCTGDWLEARGYVRDEGSVVTVLPVGNFNYCWSPVYDDMYEDLGNYVYDLNNNAGSIRELTTQFLLKNPSNITNFLMKGKYKVNTGLANAIASKKEVMINCEQVAVISQDWVNQYDERLKMINKRGTGINLGALDKDFDDIADGMKY